MELHSSKSSWMCAEENDDSRARISFYEICFQSTFLVTDNFHLCIWSGRDPLFLCHSSARGNPAAHTSASAAGMWSGDVQGTMGLSVLQGHAVEDEYSLLVSSVPLPGGSSSTLSCTICAGSNQYHPHPCQGIWSATNFPFSIIFL